MAEVGGNRTRIRSISFTVDDHTPYYAEARAKAVEDAEDKAKQIAGSAGVKLGESTYISEGSVYRPSMIRDFDGSAAALPVTETSISLGELRITINVQISYAIV